ncbi:response regulator transcription factor [Staphylococcus hyicus]|uniref:Response regulator transcription factor n=1 Tax=Staphylococcus hyicus TaxID=1284 RepID=A0ACD5FPX2_STAHY|nr:response regulator transcription factor [Staphylococcus hyicus]MCQ9291196.1 response regulator transcription factor [Staphylococcus hyicus]MCQ9306437.1 response regulator transcription factor [Staphylococcus hyicus]MCQ9308850.1 response regulator transcription factor [Staphylococcus hyicus]MCQ9311271.1 response regulator transcription factor [Staphylococcus hyicus]MDP4463677.1 response regulator transcription factor [Staphylococcus hyicus]
MKVLLIEDNRMIGDLLLNMLKLRQYTVDWLTSGEDVSLYMEQIHYDLILVDWMLPDMTGVDIIHHIRQSGNAIPIIMLTAKSQTADKVEGLTAGADDYVTKPFEFEELEARMLAVMKRYHALDKQVKTIGNVTYDFQKHHFIKEGHILEFTQKEYQLLELLFLNAVVSRVLIIEKVWYLDQIVSDNNIDALVRQLRKKLMHLDTTLHIKSIRGVGYKLEVMP